MPKLKAQTTKRTKKNEQEKKTGDRIKAKLNEFKWFYWLDQLAWLYTILAKVKSPQRRKERRETLKKIGAGSCWHESIVISYWPGGSTNDYWPLTNGDKIRNLQHATCSKQYRLTSLEE